MDLMTTTWRRRNRVTRKVLKAKVDFILGRTHLLIRAISDLNRLLDYYKIIDDGFGAALRSGQTRFISNRLLGY